MKSGLQKRVIYLILGLGLFPLFLSGIFLQNLTKNLFSKEAQSRLQAVAELIGRSLRSDFHAHWRELDLLRDYLMEEEFSREEALQILRRELNHDDVHYTWYGLADGDGEMRIVETAARTRSVSVADEDWFKRAKKEEKHFAEGSVSRLSDGGVAVHFTAPLLSGGGEFLGALHFEIPVERLIEDFKRYNADPTVNILLLDEYGNVLGDRLGDETGPSVESVAKWPVFRELEENEVGSMIGEAGGDRQVFAAMVKMDNMLTFPGLKWRLLAVQPTSSVYSSLGIQGQIIAVFMFGGAVMAGLLTVLIIGGMTRPIRALSKATQQIAEGDYSSRVKIMRNDEIGDLAESFNRMASGIEKYRSEAETRTAEILALKEFNEGIIRSAPVGIVILDSECRMTGMNPAFRRIFNTTDANLGQKLCGMSFVKNTVLERYLNMSESGQSFEIVNMEARLANGDRRVATWIGTPMSEDVREMGSMFLLAIDRTRQVEMEESMVKTREKMIQSDKLATIGQLAAGVSHEINNPIGIIKGFSQELLEELEEDSELRPDIQHIFDAASQCEAIVRGLLQFARPAEMQPERVDIARLLNDILDSVEPQRIFKKIKIKRDLQPDLPAVWGSPGLYRQVFMNFVVNAAHAIQDAGNLGVSARIAAPERPGDRSFLEIVFEDDGCGIPKENLKKIFDPFFTTKDPGKGTGLGLSISYGIIKKYQGTIEVESEPGRGTRFKIKLHYLEHSEV